jgi:hypothetical protein
MHCEMSIDESRVGLQPEWRQGCQRVRESLNTIAFKGGSDVFHTGYVLNGTDFNISSDVPRRLLHIHAIKIEKQ